MIEITPEIIASFRTVYPIFTNIVTWPDEILTTALCEGDAETGGRGWGFYSDACHNFKRRGMFLYAAHWLITTYPRGASDTQDSSATPRYGVASKSVGDESISYANGGLNDLTPGDGWLAATSYGQQWLRLRRRAGTAARAV